MIGAIAGGGSGRRFTAEFVTKKMQERFASLQDEEKKKAAFQKLTSGQVSAFLADAPVNIVVCGKKDVWDLPYDTSAAIENMLLMVTALGLGACWVIAPCIDIRDEERIKGLLGIPEGFKVISIISIGHPTRPTGPVPAFPSRVGFPGKMGRNLTMRSSMNNKTVPLDYANSLMYELEKAFWDERGRGARFRLTTVGLDFMRKKSALLQSSDLDQILHTIEDVLRQQGIATK